VAGYNQIGLIQDRQAMWRRFDRLPRTGCADSVEQGRSEVALEIELQPPLHKLARKRAILSIALARRAQLLLVRARLHGSKLLAVTLRLAAAAATGLRRLGGAGNGVGGGGIHPATSVAGAAG
jgi:hypothetical protein